MNSNLEKQIVWEGLKEYEIGEEDFLNWFECGFEGKIEVLKKLNINQYVVFDKTNSTNKSINNFNEILDNLKDYGFDIGKGDAEYGYKMPLPEKKGEPRKLIIFKRR
jgi:hypothetical protein